jgi:hypothetical protein
MGAITLQGQGPKYQAEFKVEGGGVADLALLWLRDRFTPNYPTLKVRELDGTKVWDILVAQITDQGLWGSAPRAKLEIRGFLLEGSLAREVNSQTIYPAVELTYSTHSRRGLLRVLAHDQPPPVIEIIEWCQLVHRANQRKGDVLEVRYEGPGKVRRGLITKAEFYNDRFLVGCHRFFAPVATPGSVVTWCRCEAEGDVLRASIPQEADAPKPLVFQDGRIMFEIPTGSQSSARLCCTIYPQTQIEWK